MGDEVGVDADARVVDSEGEAGGIGVERDAEDRGALAIGVHGLDRVHEEREDDLVELALVRDERRVALEWNGLRPNVVELEVVAHEHEAVPGDLVEVGRRGGRRCHGRK